MSLGKKPLWEDVIWESAYLGNSTWESVIWESAFGKDPNTSFCSSDKINASILESTMSITTNAIIHNLFSWGCLQITVGVYLFSG